MQTLRGLLQKYMGIIEKTIGLLFGLKRFVSNRNVCKDDDIKLDNYGY